LFAVVDQSAHEEKDAAHGARYACAGPMRIGLGCWGGGWRVGRHRLNKSTKGERCQGNNA
jgi:hypothetical protein